MKRNEGTEIKFLLESLALERLLRRCAPLRPLGIAMTQKSTEQPLKFLTSVTELGRSRKPIFP